MFDKEESYLSHFMDTLDNIALSLRDISYSLAKNENYKYGHKIEDLENNYAGILVPNPNKLPAGTFVTLFQYDTEIDKEGEEAYNGGWWEHGEIYEKEDQEGNLKKGITTYDSVYDLHDTWECYLDTRYNQLELIKQLGL